MSNDVYQQTIPFTNFIRPEHIKDKTKQMRDLFTTSTKQAFLSQMKTTVVSQCLTRAFGRSKVLLGVKNRFNNISLSGIRFSAITELICLGNESLDSVPHCFAKHGTKVCKRFYVQFFSNREAARLSWKCTNLFTHVNQDEEKTVSLREKLLSKAKVPNSTKIKKWCEEIRIYEGMRIRMMI